MISRRELLAAASIVTGTAALGAASPALATSTIRTSPVVEPCAPQASATGEQFWGYFRAWRDVANSTDTDRNKVTMADIPPEITLVSAFGGASDAFKNTLRDEYVPQLNAQGTTVVRTVFVDTLLNTDYPNTDAGYADLAGEIIASEVTSWGVNGFDVDVERTVSGEDEERAIGVFTALRAELGDKTLIFDTNAGATDFFRAVVDDVDYLLMQKYGAGAAGAQRMWDSYKDLIAPEQYFPGFSFYEENAPYTWSDTVPTFETCPAYDMASWEPAEGKKGGTFAYALDRDGTKDGDNTISNTDFSWSKHLLQVSNGTYVTGSFDVDG